MTALKPKQQSPLLYSSLLRIGGGSAPYDGCLFIDKHPRLSLLFATSSPAIAGLFLRRGFRPPTTVTGVYCILPLSIFTTAVMLGSLLLCYRVAGNGPHNNRWLALWSRYIAHRITTFIIWFDFNITRDYTSLL